MEGEALPIIDRPQSPGSDTESVLSSSQPPSYLNGGLYSANASTLNLSALAGTSASAGPSMASLGGFNAISTVLNNPHKRQHPIDPSSSRYPALPSHKDADLKKPKKDVVQDYIDEVTKEWDRYTLNRKLGARGRAKTLNRNGEEGESAPIAEPSDLSSSRSKERLPPLSSVPPVFFEDNFNLGNPYTFDIVTERYGAVTGEAQPVEPSPVAGMEAGDQHLEKLSHYSDIVEQHLLHEIAAKSSSFFSALGTLQDLSQSSAACLSQLSRLRSGLVAVQDSQVKTGLQIVRCQDRRRATLLEMEAVSRVQRWCEAKRMSELLVAHGEYGEALLAIDGLRSQMRPPSRHEAGTTAAEASEEPLIDMSQIAALQALMPDLDELERSIGVRLESELVGILRADLSNQHDLGNHAATRQEWPLADRIEPLVAGLIKTQGLESALTSSYRPLTLAGIRDALRRSLPTSDTEPLLAPLFDLLDDDVAASGRGEPKTGEAGNNAAQKLREMSAAEFQTLLAAACEGLEAGIAKIREQEHGMLQILDRMARQSEVPATQESAQQAQDQQHLMPPGVPFSLPTILASQLHAAIEVAHILTARLISLRASSHAQMTMREFLAFHKPLVAFIERTERVDVLSRMSTEEASGADNTSEAIDNRRTAVGASFSQNSATGGRRLIPLRSTLLNQSKEWLRRFHRVRLEQAARFVEEETWAQADVPSGTQELLRKLIGSAEEDPADWLIRAETPESDLESKATEENTAETTYKGLTFPEDGANDTSAAGTKLYYVVPATIKVIDLTKDYMQAVINMGRVVGTTEIMAREVEFLKQFNSRTCQVVLGAGAMRSAGLKNITAKHLALASQSLSLFIHLIPYLRECVRRHLPDERQAVMLVEFDKLKRDFQEHMYEIHAKLVAIMGDRLTVHCRSLSATDWNAALDADTEPAPNKAIVDLVKETSTLHKVLSKYLQPSVVESITTQVLSAIVQRVGTEFAKVEVTSQGGNGCQRRMESDFAHLDSRLSSLKGSENGGWNGDGLKAIIASKTPPVAQVKTPTAPKETTEEKANLTVSAPTEPDTVSTPPASPRPDSPASQQRNAPAAYRSKMFPFGRRSTASQSPQTSSPRAVLSPSVAQSMQQNIEAAARPSLDVVALPPPAADPVMPQSDQLAASEAPSTSTKDAETKASTDASGAAEPAPNESVASEENTEVAALPGEPSEGGGAAEPRVTAQEDSPPLDAKVSSKTLARSETREVDVESPETHSIAEVVQPLDKTASLSGQLEALGDTTEAVPLALVDTSASSPAVEVAAGAKSLDSEVASQVEEDHATTAPSNDIARLPESESSNVPSVREAVKMEQPSPEPAPATPTKPIRMTLQQRLAEAARKRAAASSRSQQPTPGAGEISTPAPKKAEPEPTSEAVVQVIGSVPSVTQDEETPGPPTPTKDVPRRVPSTDARVDAEIKDLAPTTDSEAHTANESQGHHMAEVTRQDGEASQQGAEARDPSPESPAKQTNGQPKGVEVSQTTQSVHPLEAEDASAHDAIGHQPTATGFSTDTTDAADAAPGDGNAADCPPEKTQPMEQDVGLTGEAEGEGDAGGEEAGEEEEEGASGTVTPLVSESVDDASAKAEPPADSVASTGTDSKGASSSKKKKKKKGKKK
ncbi:unnamed protein product [Parajaminaea phylloscopi]